MGEARSRANWAHTSSVLATLFNSHRMSKDDPWRKPSDFDPHAAPPAAPAKPIVVGIDALKIFL